MNARPARPGRLPRASRCLPLLLAVLLAAVSAGTGPAHADRTAYAQIEGSGSTWSEVIVQQWISDVDALGMKVTYNGGGSSQGRKNFAQNVTDFGISEIPYPGVDEYGNADNAGSRSFAYLPVVAGGTAFTYQLKIGKEQVKNLRLSGETLAKIFTNQITNWNDPAISKDNNGRKFPSLQIIPVVRSDGSGTTAQFTTWMDAEHPGAWRSYFGKSGYTSYYPTKGRMVAQSGSDQMMNYISGFAGNGSIGYVEYAYPLNKKYPVVKMLNEGGYYVEPTQHNVAVALTKARINQDSGSKDYLTQILDDVYTSKDPRAYPLSSYSYMVVPTGAKDQRMTTAKRQTLGDFLYYSLCEGQSKAGAYGYSPLPLNLVQAAFAQVSKLGEADKAVDLKNRSVSKCNNPTFVGGDLKRNKLAEIAVKPAACDKVGAGPCGFDTGTGTQSGDAGKASNKNGSTPAAGTQSQPETGDTTPNSVPGAGDVETALDPTTGEVVGAAPGTESGAAVSAEPVELSAARPGDQKPFAWLAIVLLLALVLVPGILLGRLSGAGGAKQRDAR